VSLRGSDVPGFNVRFSFQYIFLKPIIRGVWKNAKKVVANSEGLKNLARKTLDIPIDIIYNGVDIKEFTPQYNENEKLNILCVSRLIGRKGIEYLIEGIKNLDVELTIVGEGIEEEKLKRLCREIGVQDRVHFKGYVPHDKIKGCYAKADIYVQPSLNEGMSNTVLEAMASGLPIITTDTGGTKELIKKNGIVVPMKDSEAIKRAVSRYVQKRELVKKHGRTSRKIAEGMS
jgi:glycosyltransferase involved in cell wall biosynthesis